MKHVDYLFADDLCFRDGAPFVINAGAINTAQFSSNADRNIFIVSLRMVSDYIYSRSQVR